MNIQIAATIGGRLAAVSPTPVHGARHDAQACAASGLGYTGVDGMTIVLFRTPPTARSTKPRRPSTRTSVPSAPPPT